jgi:formate hydrogenlyase subunit 3/multisubunit Na+/H+ antiporter MnhD subunit
MELYWIIAAPLLAAPLSPWLVRAVGAKAAGAVLALVAGPGCWRRRKALGRASGLAPSMGVEMALRVGGFERLFLFLVAFIGGLVLIYGGAYLDGDSKVAHFFVIVLMFMAAMLGVIAADDMILHLCFLGTDEPDLVPAGGIQVLRSGGAQGGLAGAVGHRCRRPGAVGGLILLTQITGETRISALAAHSGSSRKPLVRAGIAAGAGRGFHQIRAGAIPFLASRRDGRTHAGERLSAFRHDGEGRRDPAGETFTGDVPNRAVGLDRRPGGRADHAHRRGDGRASKPISSACWPTPR